MSVSNTQWYHWVPPYAPQARDGASPGADFASMVGAATQNPAGTAAEPVPRHTTNPAATLGTEASGPGAGAAPHAAADLRPVYGPPQAPQSIGDPAPSPGVGRTGSAAPVQPQSHHHQRRALASWQAAVPASGSHRSVSQVMAADTAQALQAYASSSSSAALTELTA